jgi:hypothetical protein
MFLSQGNATPYYVMNNTASTKVLLASGEIPVIDLTYAIMANLEMQVQLCSIENWH